MNECIDKICPYCRTKINVDDATIVCPSCGIPHHESCWKENLGCTTFGCSSHSYEEQHINPPNVCHNCGALLGDGQMFCPQCGAQKASDKLFCSHCGAELADGQLFCSQCGQNVMISHPGNLRQLVTQTDLARRSATVPKKKQTLPRFLGIACGIIAIAAIVFLFVSKKPTSISLSKSSVTIERGETYTLGYDVTPSKASDCEIEWKTDDENVAEVDDDGVVTAIFPGSCDITVTTENGKADSCFVTVEQPSEEKLVVGTWYVSEILDFDTMDSLPAYTLNWNVCINNDNTITLDFDTDSGDYTDVWLFAGTNDYGDNVYITSQDGIYFIYAEDEDEIWLYFNMDDIDWCITCE